MLPVKVAARYQRQLTHFDKGLGIDVEHLSTIQFQRQRQLVRSFQPFDYLEYP